MSGIAIFQAPMSCLAGECIQLIITDHETSKDVLENTSWVTQPGVPSIVNNVIGVNVVVTSNSTAAVSP